MVIIDDRSWVAISWTIVVAVGVSTEISSGTAIDRGTTCAWAAATEPSSTMSVIATVVASLRECLIVCVPSSLLTVRGPLSRPRRHL
jgi:hypothetical protein